MVYSEGAKLINAQELKEIIEGQYSNPTVERLMFIEVKEKENMPGKVFPCYIEAWGEEAGKTEVEADHLVFQCCIAQCMNGEFSLLRVYIREYEFGVIKRIWDKPPTKGLREETAWLATAVEQ